MLLYAYNSDAPQHGVVSQWVLNLFKGAELIGLPWVTIWAFIRISTNSRVFANPRPAKEAFAIVSELLAQPGVAVLHPGPRHAEILEKLVSESDGNGRGPRGARD